MARRAPVDGGVDGEDAGSIDCARSWLGRCIPYLPTRRDRDLDGVAHICARGSSGGVGSGLAGGGDEHTLVRAGGWWRRRPSWDVSRAGGWLGIWLCRRDGREESKRAEVLLGSGRESKREGWERWELG